jgi:hypothetical protein
MDGLMLVAVAAFRRVVERLDQTPFGQGAIKSGENK